MSLRNLWKETTRVRLSSYSRGSVSVSMASHYAHVSCSSATYRLTPALDTETLVTEGLRYGWLVLSRLHDTEAFAAPKHSLLSTRRLESGRAQEYVFGLRTSEVPTLLYITRSLYITQQDRASFRPCVISQWSFQCPRFPTQLDQYLANHEVHGRARCTGSTILEPRSQLRHRDLRRDRWQEDRPL